MPDRKSDSPDVDFRITAATGLLLHLAGKELDNVPHTGAAIEAGRAAGAAAASLEATSLGYPVYERMGFRRVDDYVTVGLESAMFPR